ncbi:MAG: hypothetical protein HY236_00915 [Acidobacteria bacterium]|nr:hypothetical protein [Acidobacteriota bacterium]
MAGSGTGGGGMAGDGQTGIGGAGDRNVEAGTAGLEALDLVEGAVEGALDPGLVADEPGDGVGVVNIPAKSESDAIGRSEVVVALGSVVEQVDDALVEEAGFDAAEAAQAPGGHDHLLHERGFQRGG